MINKLALVYQLSIDVNNEKYILIGHTFDLIKTKNEILEKLKSGKHENIKFQNKFNDLMKTDPLHLGLYFRYETLQSLRTDYYPNNVLPLVMEQLERSFIQTIREDLRIKGKEHLLMND